MPLVYSYYVLDIVHKGHLLMMENAKAVAGVSGTLIVGILTDDALMEKKRKPVMSFDERVDLARAIRFTDVVVAQENYSPLLNIQKIRPDILMESDSHDAADIHACRKFMEDIGGKVITVPYYPTRSSSDIKEQIKSTV